MSDEKNVNDPRLEGAELKYEGRTLEVKLYLNTDETAHEVLYRLQKAAKDPKGVMIAAMVAEITGEDAQRLWKVIWDAMVTKGKPVKG